MRVQGTCFIEGILLKMEPFRSEHNGAGGKEQASVARPTDGWGRGTTELVASLCTAVSLSRWSPLGTHQQFIPSGK